MIEKMIIDLIASKTKIRQRELIEKDLVLHRLLLELTDNKQFSENYAFKGGTCLMKCYLGYYRFSEDLDFTYINQKEFAKKSEKQIRKIISEKINSLNKTLEEISKRMGLDFKLDKRDSRYFEFGGGNKLTTIKLWYISEETKKETFIKIQINFIERLFYSIENLKANNILLGRGDESQLDFLLPEDHKWILKIPSPRCYDIKEILIEKIRAILTRRGTKERDFIDVFLIVRKNKFDLENFKKQIIGKTLLMIEKYRKYVANIRAKDFGFIDNFKLGNEEKLMIKEIPKGFENFLSSFQRFLDSIRNGIKN